MWATKSTSISQFKLFNFVHYIIENYFLVDNWISKISCKSFFLHASFSSVKSNGTSIPFSDPV